MFCLPNNYREILAQRNIKSITQAVVELSTYESMRKLYNIGSLPTQTKLNKYDYFENTASLKVSPSLKKFCKYHRQGSHSTEECIVLQANKQSLRNLMINQNLI